ncbi:MAG: hypothetical protein FJZ90_01200 [Chloroflexi bacterium]|nr:hypothetical protein [Chloroflexota bacterium]
MDAVLPSFLLVVVIVGVSFAGLTALALGGVLFMWYLVDNTGSHGKLLARYPAPGPLEGEELRRQHVQIGAVRWRFCVTVTMDPRGLGLTIRRSLKSPPAVLIPWSEIKAAEKVRLYWSPAWRLHVGEPKVADVIVMKNVYDRVRPHLSFARD